MIQYYQNNSMVHGLFKIEDNNIYRFYDNQWQTSCIARWLIESYYEPLTKEQAFMELL